jgi:hypothetical protein
VNRTRVSLYYLAGYLIAGGVALLLAPDQTLKFLLSNAHYGNVFPRLAGMALSGLGMNIAGIIRARAQALYPGTLIVRSYFIVCLVSLYWLSRDPFFLTVLVIVGVGVALTLTCYLADRAQAGNRGRN